ncbi:MAG TPA: hypothetical protein VN847_02880 [Streptosporangiaceae bacterium]|nr:hypothetical protein [Streptosporangiaceae bacterium]
MNTANGNNATDGLRGWWASPPRTGIRRTIAPWEYRHLRGSGLVRIAGGSFLALAGVLLLSYQAYGWAALFLVLAVLNLAGGYWYMTMARSVPPR